MYAVDMGQPVWLQSYQTPANSYQRNSTQIEHLSIFNMSMMYVWLTSLQLVFITVYIENA